MQIPKHSRVRALGYVSDALRAALLAHAQLLIVPSRYESLSIVLLEAWNRGIRALVNAPCRVLDGQVRRANGGLTYRSVGEFREALDFQLTHDDSRKAFGRQGLAYVERGYRWPIVMDRVERLLDTVRRDAPRTEGPASSGPLPVLSCRMLVRRLALALSLLAVYALGVIAQQPPPKRPPEELLRLSLAAEKPGLAEPFTGVTTNGRIESGLFPVRSSGVSTAAVGTAAETFLAGLTPEQRKKTVYPVDDPEWRKWMNQSFYVRQGVSFLDMTAPQRELAFGLLRAALSARGLKQTRDIMRLNETLAELTGGNFDEYGEWRYHITVMGTPSATEPWGWQLDGHHAIVNYFVLGDQVVMTPHFYGSEPVRAESGTYKGTVVMQDEQNRGLAFVNALDEPRRKQAILSFAKESDNNLTEAWKDNVVLDYSGIRAAGLSDAQRTQLLDLIALYVGNMDDGHAKVKMADVRAHLDRTYFAWIGPTDANSVFYYRIHSPVILIEFDHQRPVGTRHLIDPSRATRQHIHAVVRTPNGNDYGKDLLRQHYLQHPH